jgi:4-hydroxybenzoate polyprenyltransferase
MPSLAKIIRTDNWFSQKLPPLLAVAYAFLLVGAVEPISVLQLLPLVVLCICLAAYGHVINDIFDVEADAAAGRPNAMTNVPVGLRVGLLVLLVAGGFGCLAAMGGTPVLFGLLAVNYLLPTLYSVPPIRLKERGISSVLSDTLGSHVVPTLFVGMSLQGISSADPVLEWRLILSATCWAFFVGLRGILVHQVVDQRNDQAANVVTFGARLGGKAVRSFVVKVVLPFEGLTLGLFLYFLLPFSPVLTGAVILYALGEISRLGRGLRLPHVFPEEPDREPHVPFLKNDFHEVWLPCALAVQLAIDRPAYVALLIVHVVLFRRGIKDLAILLARFAQMQLGRFLSRSKKDSDLVPLQGTGPSVPRTDRFAE